MKPLISNDHFNIFVNLLLSCSNIEIRLDKKCDLPGLHVTRKLYIHGKYISSIEFKLTKNKPVHVKHMAYPVIEMENRIAYGKRPVIEVIYFISQEILDTNCGLVFKASHPTNNCETLAESDNSVYTFKSKSLISWSQAESKCSILNLKLANVKSDEDVGSDKV